MREEAAWSGRRQVIFRRGRPKTNPVDLPIAMRKRAEEQSDVEAMRGERQRTAHIGRWGKHWGHCR
jgi:hypothetical protein